MFCRNPIRRWKLHVALVEIPSHGFIMMTERGPPYIDVSLNYFVVVCLGDGAAGNDCFGVHDLR